ncbi:MAG: hypothetical protein WBO36_14700 [Saprospiraceae bacterium]
MNIFIPKYVEILKALNDHVVQYLLIGGYAVIIHGYDRGLQKTWISGSSPIMTIK